MMRRCARLRRHAAALVVGLFAFAWFGGILPATERVAGAQTGDPGRVAQTLVQTVDERAAAQAQQRMRINLGSLQVDAFREATSVDGRGVLIAVVDTGIDPAHPALRATTQQAPKLIDWIDFTGRGGQPAEGDVALTPVGESGGSLDTPYGTIALGPVRSQSGQYLVGRFEPGRLPGLAGNPPLVVVAVDEVEPGVYDRVYVDLDRDGMLDPSARLALFRESGRHLAVPVDTSAYRTVLNLVLTNVDPDRGVLNFGFDANGHGTQVAGIAAGYDGERFQGVAPGAQLLALKALSSRGEGAWSQVENAVRFAADAGADIITISIGALGAAADQTRAQRFLDETAASCQCLIVMAAGNDGPGLRSGTTPGSAARVLAAGAYYTPEMIEWDYGYRPQQAGVWYYSGMGPRRDGSLLPNVLAPGSAPAPIPLHVHPEGYQTLEGTSAAAPHAAGAAALLLEASRRQGLVRNGLQLKHALEQGARSLPEFNLLEQGYGVVNLPAAWTTLQQERQFDAVRATPVAAPQDDSIRTPQAAGRLLWQLETRERPLTLTLRSTAPWLVPERAQLRLVPGLSRRVAVDLQQDRMNAPGVYAALLRLDADQSHTDLLHVQIEPLGTLPAARTLWQRGQLSPGRWQRYFVDIDTGTSQVDVTLSVPAAIDPERIRLVARRPDGQLHVVAAASPSATTPTVQLTKPLPGRWEWLVFVPFEAGMAGLDAVPYQLRFEASGVRWRPREPLALAGDAATSLLRMPPLAIEVYGKARALQVSSHGWNRQPVLDEHFYASISGREPFQHEFRVDAGTGRLQVAIDPPRDLPDGSLTLYLYRRSPLGTTAQVAETRNSRGGRYLITLDDPQPGSYVLWVEARHAEAIEYHGSIITLPEGASALLVRPLPDAPILRHETPLLFTPPAEAGAVHAALSVRDALRGDVIGVIPVRWYGQTPPLRVWSQLQRDPLDRVWLTVTLSDPATDLPVPGTIQVDGRIYAAPDGRLSIRLPERASSVSFTATADGYAPQTLQRSLPPAGRETVQILPGEQEELQPFRKKLWHQFAEWLDLRLEGRR